MQVVQKTLSTALFLLFGLFAFAQTSIGIKGGLNYTNISQPDIINAINIDFKSITGASFGLVAEIGLGDHFAIQPELGYSQKGFKIEEGLDLELFNIPVPLGAKVVTRFNYIEAPVLAKAKFGNEKVQGYLAAGPQFAYATGGRFKTQANVLSFDIPISNTKLDLDALGFERFDIGMALAAGVQVNTVGGGAFFADLRYNKGFNDVYDIPVVEVKLENSGFGFNVGYLIPLTRKSPVTSRPRA
jgi:Outer membrane protein beta-barrel domain